MRRQLRIQAFLQGFVHGFYHPFLSLRTWRGPHLRPWCRRKHPPRQKKDHSYRRSTRPSSVEFRHSPLQSNRPTCHFSRPARLQEALAPYRVVAELRLSYSHGRCRYFGNKGSCAEIESRRGQFMNIPEKPLGPDFRERAKANDVPVARLIGFEAKDIAGGRATVVLAAGSQHANPHG